MDRLAPILSRGDLVAAYELLHGLDHDELRDAKTWFADSRRWFRDLGQNVSFAGDTQDDRAVSRHEGMWIVSLCAVVLCGPRTAAQRVPWDEHWDYMEHEGEAAFVQLLWERDRGWVAEFVVAASEVRLGRHATNVNPTLSRVLRAVATHHGLPCPPGDTFIKVWYAGTPLMQKQSWQMDRSAEGLAAWLAVDPLMPELLLRFLASGESGDLPELPGAVGRLVRSGSVDRSAVLGETLQQLTTNQRPKSQRVLAGILAELELGADEVPGGLTYLLGVLSTADRALHPALLPTAIALMSDSAGCRQLADVIAARPEKKAKEPLLAGLKQPETVERVGVAAVGDALDVLGAGDDAAFSAKIVAARESLGLVPRPYVTTSCVSGSLGSWIRYRPAVTTVRTSISAGRRTPPGPGDSTRATPTASRSSRG